MAVNLYGPKPNAGKGGEDVSEQNVRSFRLKKKLKEGRGTQKDARLERTTFS